MSVSLETKKILINQNSEIDPISSPGRKKIVRTPTTDPNKKIIENKAIRQKIPHITLKAEQEITTIKNVQPIKESSLRFPAVLDEIQNYQRYKLQFQALGAQAFPNKEKYTNILSTFGNGAGVQEAWRLYIRIKEKNDGVPLELHCFVDMIEKFENDPEGKKKLMSFFKVINIYESCMKYNQPSQSFIGEVLKDRYQSHLMNCQDVMYALTYDPNPSIDPFRRALQEFREEKKLLKQALGALISWSLNSEDSNNLIEVKKKRALRQVDSMEGVMSVLRVRDRGFSESGKETEPKQTPIPFQNVLDIILENVRCKAPINPIALSNQKSSQIFDSKRNKISKETEFLALDTGQRVRRRQKTQSLAAEKTKDLPRKNKLDESNRALLMSLSSQNET